MLYSNTGMSGLVTGRDRGSERYLVLYYWLIPHRNTKDGIRIDISSLLRGAGVKGGKCGSNGSIILGLGGAAWEGTFVRCTGLLAVVCGWVIPSSV